MANTAEVPTATTALKKPDGTLTTQINNQIYIIEVFFNHNSKDTFQDKLIRIIKTQKPKGEI